MAFHHLVSYYCCMKKVYELMCFRWWSCYAKVDILQNLNLTQVMLTGSWTSSWKRYRKWACGISLLIVFCYHLLMLKLFFCMRFPIRVYGRLWPPHDWESLRWLVALRDWRPLFFQEDRLGLGWNLWGSWWIWQLMALLFILSLISILKIQAIRCLPL